MAENKIARCKELFGCHPEDVIDSIKTASKCLGWMESICKAIDASMQSKNPADRFHAQRLAEAGAYLAQDFANIADTEQEEMRAALKQSGVELSA